MPDILDGTGLQTKDLTTLISELEAGFKAIYGNDINVSSNSPDGQLVNIFAQAGIDIRELLTDVYNSYNPDTASGALLDQRVVINNIIRKAGTYTIQPVALTVDTAVSLEGLDTDIDDPEGSGYTVADDSGNEFILVDTQSLAIGTHTVNFRAKNIGLVETTIGTITNAVTVVLGVITINNAVVATTTGQNEETDAQLRVRRANSVSNASNGYLNGLLGTALDLEGVSEVKIYENVTDAVDADGIPAHGIWLIAEGGANDDIGNTIYEKKSFGCNMKGVVEVDIITPSGGTFTAKFDRPVSEDLYIRFDLQPSIAGTAYDLNNIKDCMVAGLDYTIGQVAETSRATVAIINCFASLGVDGVPLNVEVSVDGTAWVDYLETVLKNGQHVLDATRITITEL